MVLYTLLFHWHKVCLTSIEDKETASEQEKEWPIIRSKAELKAKEAAIKAGVEFFKLPPETEAFYYHAAYDFSWEEDAKKWPADVAGHLKKLLRKQ